MFFFAAVRRAGGFFSAPAVAGLRIAGFFAGAAGFDSVVDISFFAAVERVRVAPIDCTSMRVRRARKPLRRLYPVRRLCLPTITFFPRTCAATEYAWRAASR